MCLYTSPLKKTQQKVVTDDNEQQQPYTFRNNNPLYYESRDTFAPLDQTQPTEPEESPKAELGEIIANSPLIIVENSVREVLDPVTVVQGYSQRIIMLRNLRWKEKEYFARKQAERRNRVYLSEKETNKLFQAGYGNTDDYILPGANDREKPAEYAMIYYIIKKNGGKVSYDSNTGETLVEITRLGTTYRAKYSSTYDAPRLGVFKYYDIVNGRGIMPVEHFERIYHLPYSKSSHVVEYEQDLLEGNDVSVDKFETMEDAVLAFALKFHNRSRHERVEYIANIDYVSNAYILTSVKNSRDDSIEKSAFDRLGDDAQERNQVSKSPGLNTKAMVHTHWSPNSMLFFSESDFKESKPYALYMVNKNGGVMYAKYIGEPEEGTYYGYCSYWRKKGSVQLIKQNIDNLYSSALKSIFSVKR